MHYNLINQHFTSIIFYFYIIASSHSILERANMIPSPRSTYKTAAYINKCLYAYLFTDIKSVFINYKIPNHVYAMVYAQHCLTAHI